LLAARPARRAGEIDAAVVREREAQRRRYYATSLRDLARQNVDVQLEAYGPRRTPLSDLLAAGAGTWMSRRVT